jgi:cyclopropane fatty-acyl-phospholipid synthase-like methyltransferase
VTGNLSARLSTIWWRIAAGVERRVLEGFLLRRKIERLYLVIGGHIFFQTLSAAVQLDLFTLLSRHGSLTQAEIAKHLSIADKPTRILLLGCTALGFLRKTGSRYSNTLVAQRVLRRGTVGSLVPVVEWQHHVNYQPMHAFHEAIRANRHVGLDVFPGSETTLYGRLAHQPRLERIFQEAMEAVSTQANVLLARLVDFSHVTHLVDVGGGNGTNIIALARKYPHLRATVFDSASVCAIARRNIEAAGLTSRLDAVAGDVFTDPLPPADCFLFAHFFNIWSEERNLAILRRCHAVLPASGSVVIFNMMQSDEETGPLVAAMGSPYFLTLATGEGMLYTWAEYQRWLREAGFPLVKRQKLLRSYGVVTGTRPAVAAHAAPVAEVRP